MGAHLPSKWKREILKRPNTPWCGPTHEEHKICHCVQRAPKRVLSELPSKALILSHTKTGTIWGTICCTSNHTSNCAKTPSENPIFRGGICMIWGTILRYDFEDVLSAPPPTAARSCQPPAHVRCPPPPSVVLSATQSPCVVSSTPLHLSCCSPHDRLAVISPLHPCLVHPPPPSHCAPQNQKRLVLN